jgi:uncharacterized protein
MGRVLFFALLAVVVVWLLFGRSKRVSRKADPSRPAQPGAEEMVACAHCGVHLPRVDALSDGADLYCGEEHRRLGQRRP